MRFFSFNIIILVLASALAACGDSSGNGPKGEAKTPGDIEKQVTAANTPPAKEGIAFAVLLDTSGSMEGPKLAAAKKCVRSIVQQAEQFSVQRHINVEMVVYHFNSEASVVVPMGKPNAKAAGPLIESMSAGGSTGIGDAVLKATRQLNESGYAARHVLVVTDGENTAGTSPDSVAQGLKSMPEKLRPNVYVVAFDVDAGVFKGVKQAGWPVYSAMNETQLKQTLDEVVGGEILLEK